LQLPLYEADAEARARHRRQAALGTQLRDAVVEPAQLREERVVVVLRADNIATRSHNRLAEEGSIRSQDACKKLALVLKFREAPDSHRVRRLHPRTGCRLTPDQGASLAEVKKLLTAGDAGEAP